MIEQPHLLHGKLSIQLNTYQRSSKLGRKIEITKKFLRLGGLPPLTPVLNFENSTHQLNSGGALAHFRTKEEVEVDLVRSDIPRGILRALGVLVQ